MSQVGPEGLGIRSIEARLPASVKLNPPTDPIAPGTGRNCIVVRSFVIGQITRARADRDAVAARRGGGRAGIGRRGRRVLRESGRGRESERQGSQAKGEAHRRYSRSEDVTATQRPASRLAPLRT